MPAFVRRLRAAEDGFTLTEMLVVLVILGVVIGGIAQLLMSGINSEKDQTNRTEAQRHARLGLDKLRREIHCASSVTTPSGYPTSTVTVTLASYCQSTGGAATVTWCTNVGPSVGGVQTYALWRYVGSTCSGTGTPWASNLVDPPSVTAGKIFDASFVPVALLAPVATGGTLPPGTYSYVVTALVGGVEVPGIVAPVTVSNTSSENKISVSWSAFPPAPATPATLYNVYGRQAGDLRLLGTTAGTSFIDSGTPSASSTRAPSAKLAVSLAVDATPADAKQRFFLNDDIVLRNSRPS